jgi:hypothetical protein
VKKVTFTFRKGVSRERRAEVLEAIEGWTSVVKAGELKPGSKSEAASRMAWAEIADGTDAQDVVRRLEALEQIETAAVPPARRL